MVDDATYADLKQRLERHFKYWSTQMGLRHWDWMLEWHRGEIPGFPPDEDGLNRTQACVDTNPERLQFHIQFSLSNINTQLFSKAENDPDQQEWLLEQTIIHELCHVLVCEMRSRAFLQIQEGSAQEDYLFHEERVVAQLTNAFCWVANTGTKRPRRKLEKRRKRTQEGEQYVPSNGQRSQVDPGAVPARPGYCVLESGAGLSTFEDLRQD